MNLSKRILTPKPNNRELTIALLELYSALQSPKVPADQLDVKLAEYVFFPLSHVLRQYQKLSDRPIELALQCLEILLRTAWRLAIAPQLAKQLLALLTFIVGGNPGQKGGGDQSNRSEETKLAGCKCLCQLFGTVARSSPSGGAAEVVFGDIPAVGHTATTLLTAFAEADMLELQLVALKAAEALLMDAVDDDDMRASFYPGVVSGLVRALGLGKTTKRPYQVLKAMVKILERLISSVLNDERCKNLPDGEDDGGDKLKVRRTKAWMKATAANTKVALEQVLRLRTHPRLEVRAAVFELSRAVLESCVSTLDEAKMISVETLVVVAGDPDEPLARLAEHTVLLMATMDGKIKDAVRGCVDMWIVGLPRVMTGNDEDAKQRVITRLSIAYRLCMELGMESDMLRDILADGIKDSVLAVNTSSKALVQVASAQPKLGILLADRPTASSEREIASFPDIMVGQPSQMSTMECMKQLLASLGKSSENGLILAERHLRDASTRGAAANERATSLWIALNLLRGSLGASNEMDMYFDSGLMEASSRQRCVVDELLALGLENLTTAVENDAELVENASLHCLALESLSLVAETQKRQFRGELVDALYPVVHHMGSPSPEVQNHAIVALNNIALGCGYASAKELLLDNVDYMVNSVSLKLNIFDLSPQAPVVLNMMLKLVGPKLVPHLDDLIVSIFSILDGFHEYEKLCEELFIVLGAVVEESSKGDGEAKQLQLGEEEDIGERRNKKRRPLQDGELIQLLKDLQDTNRPHLEPLDPGDEDALPDKKEFPKKPWGDGKGKEEDPPSLNFGDVDMEDDQPSPAPPPEQEPPKTSKSYEIVQRITRLSQHYLTHGSFTLRARVLHLISTASHTLGSNESEYLPVVNDIWPVVYARLFDEEAGVVMQACQAISGIAETSGDFLSTRIRDGWPGLRKVYMQAHANLEKERRVRTNNMGVYGINYKVWDAIVKMLVALVRFVGVQDEVLDDICSMCGAKVLRERADLREALNEVAPDAVWLEMECAERSTAWGGKVPVLEGFVFVQPVF